MDSYIGGYNFSLFGGKVVVDWRELKKGLDLKGGIRVVLQADMSKIDSKEQASALESVRNILEKRVNFLGVAEPVITTKKVGGDSRIIVEIPGVDNVTQAVGLIGQTAQLTFKELKPEVEYDPERFLEFYYSPDVWQETGVTGADLKGAQALTPSGSGTGDIKSQLSSQIQLKFSDEGRAKFSEVAKRNAGKPVAIYLDNGFEPLSAPTISPDLAVGVLTDPVITGDFTYDEANNLSIQLRAGALPVPISVLAQETVDATLGDESVRKSFVAGGVGLALVFLYLVYKYGRLGILAGAALLIYSVVTLAVFKLIPITLTLPGIAGFILSIGMATDGNVLIFERIREELGWGKSYDAAIKLGFDRAWNSIRDSNMSSLITSAILFQLGTGSVRGFALTLAIGIGISLFSSIFVVKTFVDVFMKRTA